MKNSSSILIGSVVIAVLFIVGIVALMGSQKEPVTLPIVVEEYSDFECPGCGVFASATKTLKEEFGEDIEFTYKHFPLEFHERAFPAAIASEAAREQGKFQEYHDLLFENQGEFSDENFIQYAEELELDIDKFKDDYENSKELQDRVEIDMQEGLDRGVNSTPTFYINGEKFKITNADRSLKDPSVLSERISELIEQAKESENV